MKILMTADTVGGVWTYALELVRALEPHGIEVVLAARPRRPDAAQRREAAALGNLTLVHRELKLEWMDDAWEDVARASAWLLELEAKHAPDLVHLNDYAHGGLAWSRPCLVVGHSCVLSWFRAVRGERAPESWDRYRLEVTRGLRAADAVVAPSRAMAAALEQHYGPLPSLQVIPNGRRPGPFPPLAKDSFVLAAGRLWDAAKNVRALDVVAPRLPWPVLLAGDDGETPRTAGGCRRLGRLSSTEVAQWMGRASIYALPARYEPFGLSALEAALAGCALVLGDIPSLRENWEGAAEFVPPGDHQALRGALDGLIRDPRRRRLLADAAGERARRFTPGRMAAGYVEAYRRLAAEVPARIPGASPSRHAGEEIACES